MFIAANDGQIESKVLLRLWCYLEECMFLIINSDVNIQHLEYDEIVDRPEELDMMQNVAYGPLQSR